MNKLIRLYIHKLDKSYKFNKSAINNLINKYKYINFLKIINKYN